MTKTPQIILGLSTKTPELIAKLKRNGKSEIYVIDYDQSTKVRERDGVVYVSLEGATVITKGVEGVTYHHYLYRNKNNRGNK